uniref:Fibrinogen C-terminal domain-containing protein n=1 Tax=Amphimedon queenslandica TaxID=400682 RepID=A0A1X7V182_AMPQE
MYSILLVLCIASLSAALDGTCVNPTTLSFIENSLSNISDQLKGSSNGVSESITSVTSLLQLTMLKEMIGSYKESSTSNNNEEGLTLLKRIELILNTSTADLNNKLDTNTAILSSRLSTIEHNIPSAISSLQSQVSALSSDLKKIHQLLEEHANVTGNCEEARDPLLSSCDAILSKSPNSPSGYYNLADVNGHSRHVYCHMETLCGKGGGWRRIASLNMTDPNENCPTQFRSYSSGGVRVCGRPVTNTGGSASITFPSSDIRYSQVCGKVIGYQKGFPDGVMRKISDSTINSPAYIDGISLTYGNPRKHLWTFISGGTGSGPYNRCPCGTTGQKTYPSFVGSNYYCEAGYETGHWATYSVTYTSDPLWDGKGCGSSETNCCQRTLIPWFYRSFTHSTTDYIEMRIGCDEGTHDEDVPVGEYEIYVK